MNLSGTYHKKFDLARNFKHVKSIFGITIPYFVQTCCFTEIEAAPLPKAQRPSPASKRIVDEYRATISGRRLKSAILKEY